MEIYKKTEISNVKLVKKLFIFAAIVNIGFYITTGLMPILYTLFNVPDPKAWILPLPAK